MGAIDSITRIGLPTIGDCRPFGDEKNAENTPINFDIALELYIAIYSIIFIY